jgi:outer membrane receptor protein involved in Fe transport
MLEEIIVTGQKIQRSLQETKESVAVVTPEEFDALVLFNLEDVFNRTANAFQLLGGETFGIRGVSQNGASTSGGNGELGSLYIDGVAYTGFATRFGPKDMWDVASVEVLRGPQSTNLGRNALVGAVQVTTQRPDPAETDAALRVRYGDYNTVGVSAMFNMPVTANSALRLSANYDDTDGYLDNITLDDDRIDEREAESVRAQFRVEPSDQLSINTMVQYVNNHRGQDFYAVGSDENPTVVDDDKVEDREATANIAGFEDFEGFSAALDIRYEINERLGFTAITSGIDGTYDRLSDDDSGPGGGDAATTRTSEERNWAQEFRLNYNGEALRGVVGVYYTEEERQTDTQRITTIDLADAGVPDFVAPLYPPSVDLLSLNDFHQETRNIAAFTEWDYDVNAHWMVSVGLRYDNEEQDITVTTANTTRGPIDLPDPDEVGNLGPVVSLINQLLLSQLGVSAIPQQNHRYEAWLPKLGVTYTINEDMQASLFYTKGYRAGGLEVSGAGTLSSFDPEYLDNYELSLRSAWLDGRLIANANAYYGDWIDQQVLLCFASVFDCIMDNAGESKIYGAELDVSYQLSSDAMVYFSSGYSETEFSEFVNAANDFSGNRFALSPRVSLSLGGRYWFDESWVLSGNLSYRDDAYANTENSREIDSRTLLDMKLAYVGDGWQLAVYGKNLTDELYIDQNSLSLNNVARVAVGAPRQVGVQFDWRLR